MRHCYSPHSLGRPCNSSIEALLVRSNARLEKSGERPASSQSRAGGYSFADLSRRKRNGKTVIEDFGRPVMQGAEALLDQAGGKYSSARRERPGIFNARTLRIES